MIIQPNEMNVLWIKCILQSRCRLSLINLNNEHFDNLTGVYVIWCRDGLNNTVKVGKGIIRDELFKIKNDKSLLQYGPDLFATWAEIPRDSLEGVEAFLCGKLHPAVSNGIKCLDLVDVNLPVI
jgi:hypothetical protein